MEMEADIESSPHTWGLTAVYGSTVILVCQEARFRALQVIPAGWVERQYREKCASLAGRKIATGRGRFPAWLRRNEWRGQVWRDPAGQVFGTCHVVNGRIPGEGHEIRRRSCHGEHGLDVRTAPEQQDPGHADQEPAQDWFPGQVFSAHGRISLVRIRGGSDPGPAQNCQLRSRYGP